MQVTRTENGYEWVLDPAERLLLIRVFECLIQEYRAHPKDLSARIRDVWYSAQAVAKAGQSDEDFEEWIRQLRQFRGEYAIKAEGWLQSWKSFAQEPLIWTLDTEDLDLFLILINDYRLARAAEMDIGQNEMEMSWKDIQDDRLRLALTEIHILAAMMEGLIKLSDN